MKIDLWDVNIAIKADLDEGSINVKTRVEGLPPFADLAEGMANELAHVVSDYLDAKREEDNAAFLEMATTIDSNPNTEVTH